MNLTKTQAKYLRSIEDTPRGGYTPLWWATIAAISAVGLIVIWVTA